MKSNFDRFMKLRKEILRECKAVLKSDYNELQCGSSNWVTHSFYVAVRVYSDRLNYIIDTDFSLKIFKSKVNDVITNIYTFSNDNLKSVVISLPEKFESMTNKEIIDYCNEEVSYIK